MGEIFLKERAIVTLTTTGASLTDKSGAAVGTDMDFRSAGNFAEDWAGTFEWVGQWGTVTGIAAGTIIADIYLVPKVDGTNLPDIDLAAGASYIPYLHRVASLVASKTPTASTNFRAASNVFYVDQPMLYTAHLINRSGQTISANWALKAISTRGQYT